MLFVLRNAAQTFHRFVDEVLKDFNFFYAYIDDVLIANSTQMSINNIFSWFFDASRNMELSLTHQSVNLVL